MNFITKILSKVLHPNVKDEIIGDLLEAYDQRAQKSKFLAGFHFFLESFASLKWGKMIYGKESFWSSQNLKFSIRHLKRNWRETAIHVSGLSLGLALCILLAFFYFHEKSFDTFHDDYASVYRVVTETDKGVKYGVSPWPTGPFIETDFPEVAATRIYHTFRKTPTLARSDKQEFFYEDDLFFVDKNFFDVLTFKLLEGQKSEVLKDPNSIVLSEALAKKLFGDENPLGQELWFESTLRLTVTGIVENAPPNSHLQYQAFSSLEDIASIFQATGNRFSYEGWYWTAVNTYVRLPPGLTAHQLEADLVDFSKRHVPEEFAHRRNFKLQPLAEMHLNSDEIEDIFVEKRSEVEIKIALLLGVIVLSIAIINFINLASASSSNRLYSLNIKKRLGASYSQIFTQMLAEAMIIVGVSLSVSLVLVYSALPHFNELIGVRIGLLDYLQLETLGWFVAGAFIITFIMGFYPATYTLKQVSKDTFGQHIKRNTIIQKILVAFQLFASISLIYGCIIIYNQFSFLTEKDLGFKDENVLMVPIRGTEASINTALFKQRFEDSPFVTSTSLLSDIMGSTAQLVPFKIDGRPEQQNIATIFVDFDFVRTFDLEVIDGRDFDPAIHSDSNAFLINEAALSYFEDGWQGARLSRGNGKIIGVLKDFHFMDLHQGIQPLIIAMSDAWRNYLALTVQGTEFSEIYQDVESTWGELEPNRPFDAWFLDEKLNQLYQSEKNQSVIVAVFSFLSVVIAIIGLLALITEFIQNRYKEIGIRKVLGASTNQIYYLITRSIALLFLLVIAINLPLARFTMSRWLDNYPTHIDHQWMYYVYAFVLTGVLIGSLVSYKCLRAARVNPIEIIKDE